jgi:hypothetical protein
MVAILLGLYNLPKAVRQSQRQHQNHFESWIYPSKTQRGISLSDIALFEENIRLDIKNMGLFMDSLVGAGKQGTMGNGVTN